jgi:hypothetical protein
MAQDFSGQCTVTNVEVKFPYGVQAEDDTAAALTYLSLEKAETETVARAISCSCVLPGDLRQNFAAGQTVVLTVTGANGLPTRAAEGKAEAEHEQSGATRTTVSVSKTKTG